MDGIATARRNAMVIMKNLHVHLTREQANELEELLDYTMGEDGSWVSRLYEEHGFHGWIGSGLSAHAWSEGFVFFKATLPEAVSAELERRMRREKLCDDLLTSMSLCGAIQRDSL